MSDRAGTPHPQYDPNGPRFAIFVEGQDPDDEPAWRCKLRFVDRKYQDGDGFPIEAIAGGDCWPAAFEAASRFVDRALTSDRCVFV